MTASTDGRVFRKVSLDRLASPEQLDQLLPVTDARGWIALGALGLILVAAITWGALGSIPQNVTGTGILVKSGGVLDIISVAGGQITDVAVNVGDQVTAGQVVARVAQPEVAARLEEAKAALRTLRDRHQPLAEFGDKNMALQHDNLARQRAAIEKSIASAESMVEWTTKKIAAQATLVDSGLILEQTLIETREKQQAAAQRIGEGRSELAQVAVKELELSNQRQEQISLSLNKIAEAERSVEDLTLELSRKTQVTTPYTGRILEVLVEQGAVAGSGEPVFRLDLEGRMIKGLEAVIFVPSGLGKRIRVGMPVLVAPATIKKEEYGMMKATVTSVSDFPATAKGMQRVLKNEKLVEALSRSDTPYEVHADLIVDPSSPSRYRWSSSQGPPQEIRSGTLAAAQIAVDHRRPIQLLFPILRRYDAAAEAR